MIQYITIHAAALLNNCSESTIRAALDRGDIAGRICECKKAILVESAPIVRPPRGRRKGSKNKVHKTCKTCKHEDNCGWGLHCGDEYKYWETA